MRLIPGMTTGWALAAALLVLPSAARGQEGTTQAAPEPTVIAVQTTAEDADRDALRRFVARTDVQRVAHAADVDLENASSGILALEGERLSRAADQARALESKLGAQDTISISTTTVIIILLLVLLIIVVAS